MNTDHGDPSLHHVDRLLEAMAAEDARVEPPARLQVVVMQMWDDTSRRRQSSRLSDASAWRGAWWFAATAAAVAAMVLSLALPQSARPTKSEPAHAVNLQGGAGGGPGEGILLVADAALEPTAMTVVRVRMRASVLATLGMRVGPDHDDTVTVEVLVGEDGVARRIRPVRPLSDPANPTGVKYQR